jgi:coiled-coil domain-containing protein 12
MADRKERLAALAARAGRPNTNAPDAVTTTAAAAAAAAAGTGEDAEGEKPQQQEQEHRTIKFRNYTPADPNLEKKQGTLLDEPVAKRAKAEKSELQLALDRAKEEAAMAMSASGVVHAGSGGAALEADDVNVMVATAPKKINWDLKRDIQPKLDKLERRTQKALVELLRERLEREAAQDHID